MSDPSSVSTDAIDTLIQRCLGGDQTAWEDDRPPAPAQGLQHRLQVHRPARRGRGPDAGHLPEDLQVAAHVRPPREFPDLAGQRQPQPLHRSLSQRPQGARDDRSRRRRRRADAGGARTRTPTRRSSSATASSCCARRMAELPPTLRDGRRAARHPGTVLPGDRRSAGPAGRHREIAHQPRPDRAGATGATHSSHRRRDTGMNLTTDRAQGIAIVRVGETRLMYPLLADFSGAVMALLDRRRQEGDDRPVEGHLRRLGDHRLPDGPLSADDGGRRRAAAGRRATSASRRC